MKCENVAITVDARQVVPPFGPSDARAADLDAKAPKPLPGMAGLAVHRLLSHPRARGSSSLPQSVPLRMGRYQRIPPSPSEGCNTV